jgi:hypothetical protein
MGLGSALQRRRCVNEHHQSLRQHLLYHDHCLLALLSSPLVECHVALGQVQPKVGITQYSQLYWILSRKKEKQIKYNSKFQDCVDNFDRSVFTYTDCEDSIDPYKYLKCQNGKCYLNSSSSSLTCENVESSGSVDLFLGYHNPIYPSQDYWNNVILHKSDDMNEPGYLVTNLVIALLVAWAICFLCLFKGIKVQNLNN